MAHLLASPLINVILLTSILSLGEAQVRQFIRAPYKAHNEPLDVRLVLLDDQSGLVGSSSIINDIDIHRDRQPTPVVFWHGMGDTAYGSINVDRLALQRRYPGMKVYSVQIGKTAVQDELASYFSNVNWQVEKACEDLLKNDVIKQHGSFNAIGFSQGGQFMRALIERCPLKENGIRVKNFISLGGQHQGVFGLPNCFSTFCDYIRYLLTHGAYEKDVQQHLVQAEYWHDPLNEDDYKARNIFLADINNENSINETYRNSILSLDHLVLVQFDQDEMVVPRESSLFGFYEPGQGSKIVPMEDTRLYTEDRLGLKQLADTNRLHIMHVQGRHLQYNMSWFLEQIGDVYLAN